MLALLVAVTTSSPGVAEEPKAKPHAEVPRADLLVLAPHPDDESLMTAGVLADAIRRGKRVVVAFATNGDLGCERNGLVRETEALRALATLGVPADHVFFLGYPDGHLAALGGSALAPLQRRSTAGACITGNTTYANQGAGGTDLHSLLNGTPAPYAASSLVGDLAALLDRVQPRDIYVSHPVDHHLDHAFTYTYLRRALEHLPTWRAAKTRVRVHRSLVHLGGCWPTAKTPAGAGVPKCPDVRFEPTAGWPELPSPYQRYKPNEERPVLPEMRRTDPTKNPKIVAIASHETQTGPRPPLSYLYSFARRSEPFWLETLSADADGTIRRAPPTDLQVGRVEPKAEFAAGDDGYWQAVVQHAPIRCNVFVDAAEPSMNLRMLVNKESGYTLRVEPDAVALVHEPGRELRRWPLPPDPNPSSHTYSVSIDPRSDEAGIAELTVRRDWEVLGVAVDTDPISDGERLGVSVDPKRSRPTCRAW